MTIGKLLDPSAYTEKYEKWIEFITNNHHGSNSLVVESCRIDIPDHHHPGDDALTEMLIIDRRSALERAGRGKDI